VTDAAEYDRGVAAGQVLARLDSHEAHLSAINGSTERVAMELSRLSKGNAELLLSVQRLADAAEADRRTVIATAAALEKDEAQRRGNSERKWTPVQRLIAVLGVVIALLGVVALVLVSVLH
jgi:hypothetical protein